MATARPRQYKSRPLAVLLDVIVLCILPPEWSMNTGARKTSAISQLCQRLDQDDGTITHMFYLGSY